MDVKMRVFLQILQTCEESAIRIAGFGWRNKSVAQFAEAFESLADFLMFVQHATNRAIERAGRFFAASQRNDGREKNFFLFHHVRREFVFDGEKNFKHFDERRRVSAVNMRDAFGHRVEPG